MSPIQGEYDIPDKQRARSSSPEPSAAIPDVPAAPPGFSTLAQDAPAVTAAVTPRRLLSLLSSAERKKYPVTTGFLDYFPDATALVANVSYRGNEKHNPGEPLGWSRSKSADHEDCIGRHLIERHGLDGEVLHAAELAWRAMANLQMLAEKKFNLDLPAGARDGTVRTNTR